MWVWGVSAEAGIVSVHRPSLPLHRNASLAEGERERGREGETSERERERDVGETNRTLLPL
jgi:hypothetical protein